MAERILTAMYDTRGAAETARDELAALGIPSGDITIRGSSTAGTTVEEDKGFWGSLADALFPDEDRSTYAEGVRRGGYLLSVRVSDDLEDRARDVLERSDPVDIDERAESWRQSGWSGYQGGTSATTTEGATAGYASTGRSSVAGAESLRSGATESEEAIPVVEEEVRVGKREVGGGRVRVRSYVTERPVEEQVNLREERVQVERRPVDRPLEAGEGAFQERTIEATERGEEAVVDKQARVTEEVGVRKDVDTRTETVRDTVRKTEVEVEDERATRGGGKERGTTSSDRTDR
jgi:stress response protein YsnF